MSKRFDKLAKDHFVWAIKKVFPNPTPLIGDKWFHFRDKGQPADLEFTGIPKLAKATGIPVKRVGQLILKTLSEKVLDAELEMTDEHHVIVRRNKAKPKPKPEAEESAE